MRSPILSLILVLLCFTLAPMAVAQPQPQAGMPMFVVHFETGPSWDKAQAPAAQQGFAEHSANMQRLHKNGVIVFGARYDDIGMIIFTAESLAAAKTIIETDPGVTAGIFTYKLAALRVFYPWQE